MQHGYVQVYTGDGKGKTTAVLGLCLRAVGAGLKIFIGQFLKKSNFSEIKTIKTKLKGIKVEQYGSGTFVRGKPSASDVKLAAAGFLKITDAVLSGDYDIVIADELNVAVDLGMVTADNVLDLIKAKPESVELVITGRHANPRILRAADLVTEMRNRKHYYDRGVKGRRGIES